MKSVRPYSQWLLEMWDSVPDVKVLKKDVKNENAVYTIDIEGNPYQVTLIVYRKDQALEIFPSPVEDPSNKDSDFSLEIHFSSKKTPEGPFSDSLTGRNNMQDVMGGVWWVIQDWARTICKGGKLSALIVMAKTETPGDDRRAKIYGDFFMRKAKQVGVKVLGAEDMTDTFIRISRLSGSNPGDIGLVATKYYIEPISPQKLASS